MSLSHPEIAYLIRLLGGPIAPTTLTGQDALTLRVKLETLLKETK